MENWMYSGLFHRVHSNKTADRALLCDWSLNIYKLSMVQTDNLALNCHSTFSISSSNKCYTLSQKKKMEYDFVDYKNWKLKQQFSTKFLIWLLFVRNNSVSHEFKGISKLKIFYSSKCQSSSSNLQWSVLFFKKNPPGVINVEDEVLRQYPLKVAIQLKNEVMFREENRYSGFSQTRRNWQ